MIHVIAAFGIGLSNMGNNVHYSGSTSLLVFHTVVLGSLLCYLEYHIIVSVL